MGPLVALFTHGAVEPWPLPFKAGPLRNGAFDPTLPRASQWRTVESGPIKRTGRSLFLLAEHSAYSAQELQRAIGFGNIVIAARGPRLFFVLLHGEGADGNDGRLCQTRIRLGLSGGLVAVEDGKLNIHENEIGARRFGCANPVLSVGSLDARIARTAEDAAQVVLVFDDQDALAHAMALRSSATMGSSIWKVAPSPSLDSTQMRPPCISTICLAMARPRPVPPLALVLELST